SGAGGTEAEESCLEEACEEGTAKSAEENGEEARACSREENSREESEEVMARSYDVRAFMTAAKNRKAEIRTEMDALARALAAPRKRSGAVGGRSDAALAELSAAILPDLTPASYQRVAAICGFRKFLDKDPIIAREAERAGLKDWIAKIEVDP